MIRIRIRNTARDIICLHPPSWLQRPDAARMWTLPGPTSPCCWAQAYRRIRQSVSSPPEVTSSYRKSLGVKQERNWRFFSSQQSHNDTGLALAPAQAWALAMALTLALTLALALALSGFTGTGTATDIGTGTQWFLAYM